jgi:hypothetical protein
MLPRREDTFLAVKTRCEEKAPPDALVPPEPNTGIRGQG